MGSLRNPIGPLPSSIYWRRRAVALALLVLTVLLVVWVFAMGDSGGGGEDDAKKPGNSGACPRSPGSHPVRAAQQRPPGRP
ncbi:hypothetical protein NKH77_29825 [Streptomyces sp. M19]